jgi:hypothetical protein
MSRITAYPHEAEQDYDIFSPRFKKETEAPILTARVRLKAQYQSAANRLLEACNTKIGNKPVWRVEQALDLQIDVGGDF